MQLNRRAVQWYALEVTTDPAVSGWEASFDGGTTWLASTVVGTDGYSRWLVAGPDATSPDATSPDPSAKVLPLGRTIPAVRAVDNPEVIVQDAPSIDIR